MPLVKHDTEMNFRQADDRGSEIERLYLEIDENMNEYGSKWSSESHRGIVGKIDRLKKLQDEEIGEVVAMAGSALAVDVEDIRRALSEIDAALLDCLARK